MQFKDVYKRLNGRDATTEQVLKFERLVASLETTPGDAMLAILVALDHYENLYSEIPAKINKTVSDTLIGMKGAADKQAIAALASAKEDLAQAVANVAQKVAQDVSTKQKIQWAAGSVIVAFLVIGGIAWYLHNTAFNAGMVAGKAVGYEQAKDEKAAASWTNTPQGQQAYRFALTGQLDKLTNCTGNGWKIEKGWCYPYPVKDEGTYGWRIQ